MIKKVVIEIQGKEIELTIQEYHDLVRDIRKISDMTGGLGKLSFPYVNPYPDIRDKFTMYRSDFGTEVNHTENIQNMLDKLRGVPVNVESSY